MHANGWIRKLGSATEESIRRMQRALDEALPFALGIFEPSPFETTLIDEGIFCGETVLQDLWQEEIMQTLSHTALKLPDLSILRPRFGGRQGIHSQHLQPLLDEMSEVFNLDPFATW